MWFKNVNILFTPKLVNKMTNCHIDEIRRKINSPASSSDRQLFKHLSSRNGAPCAAVTDPSTGEQIFDVNEQFKCMIAQWETIYDMHNSHAILWAHMVDCLPSAGGNAGTQLIKENRVWHYYQHENNNLDTNHINDADHGDNTHFERCLF